MGIYFLVGICAGTLAGLFGVGGGIIVVPALAAIFLEVPLFAAVYMKVAIGTSLAIMIVTLSATVYAHHLRRSIHWDILQTIFPGLILGVIVGAFYVHFISSQGLRIFFGCFLILIASRFFFKKTNVFFERAKKTLFSQAFLPFISFFIGGLASLVGAGGGMMWVPIFLSMRMEMTHAVGTSSACGLVVSVVATCYFLMEGFYSQTLAPYTTGYIYWPAFFGVSLASLLFVPLGAFLAHRLPADRLKCLFALILILVAIDMLYQ